MVGWMFKGFKKMLIENKRCKYYSIYCLLKKQLVNGKYWQIGVLT